MPRPRAGWEHLSRCLTLAAALQRRRRPAYFLSQLEPGSLGLAIKRGGNEWLDADAPGRHARGPGRDGPGDPPPPAGRRRRRFARRDGGLPGASCARTGVLVVSLDSLAATPLPVAADHQPAAGPGPRGVRVRAAARRCCSAPRYALVRPEIRRVAADPRRRSRPSRSAPWSPWATTTRTTSPASWRSCC